MGPIYTKHREEPWTFKLIKIRNGVVKASLGFNKK